MSDVDLIGALAGTLTTISFIPQVLKIWSSRSAADISMGMFSLFALGVSLWLFYGLSIRSAPIIASNSVTLILSLAIIIMKIRFK